MAGYSGTPLARKLGFKPGNRVRTSNAPDNYLELVSPRPEGVQISSVLRKDIDIWHLFTRSESALKAALPGMKSAIRQDGMIWVSWPKKASKVPTDVTEDVVRRHALPIGLVDVKVCAVDDVWSGLKLVIRKELRQ
ncbi:MAG: DUF3052 domain-containing protein [Gammaproteobacteria bacterium]|nr:DUF3052 domain-containing protein [Gammaproteobacteria bacterium]